VFIDSAQGISAQGKVEVVLKEPHVSQFFKEQLMELPLA
jgi:hypothetical protein